MSEPYSNVGKVVGTLLRTGAYRATKYMSPKSVIKATRRHKGERRASRTEFVVTLGSPNYQEHKFIKQCLKVEEPFPIKKIQLKF